MKRGKEEEKYTGPMFPRLNVNDKEKGGPRAPPRNKMALYEQLSIPSQRFNNTPSSFAPPAASAQGSGSDRGLFFPLHRPKTTPLADNSYAGSNRNAPSTQLAMKDKEDEEDFAVPIFLQPVLGLGHRKDPNGADRGKNPSSGPAYVRHSVELQSSSDKDRKQKENMGSFLRQEGERQIKEKSKEFVAESARSVKESCPREKTAAPPPLKHNGPSAEHEPRDTSLSNRVRGSDVLSEHMSIQNRYSSILNKDSSPLEMRSPRNPIRDISYQNEEAIQTENGDRGDDASETSMLDSISALDISPDDVVGVIGQKQFWKARKAIVHQQRAFAVQVFELHRLVKVQKSIAGEPNLMLEDSAYLAESLKAPSTKKLPLEYIIKPPPHMVKEKENIEEAHNRLEQSADNGDAETSPPSVQNITQPSSNKPPSSVPELNNGFQQAPGHQWLIPVMSPSEGLIYKPYPGHGFPGPFFGGALPQGASPIMGNFVNPGYGYNQGNGFPTDPNQPPHGYFSPYGMPVMNPQAQGGWFPGSQGQQPGSFMGSQGSFMGSQGPPGPFFGQPGQFTGTESNSNWPQPSSGSAPTSKNQTIPDAAKLLTTYKERELQGSTASSPGGKAQRPRESRGGGTRNALNLFPTSVADRVQEEQTRVIKVVPHNALSATESAARIFQSIQEGRKHHD